MKERSLVVFTVLIQAAAGAFWVLCLLEIWLVRRAGFAADLITRKIFLALGLLIAAGLLASLFHLGSPRKAYLAVANLESSWLSREIFFSLCFAASWAAFTFGLWFPAVPPWLRILAGATASLCSLMLVYCMARIYMLRTVPGWNRPATPLAFYSTALLLGCATAGAGLILFNGAPREDPVSWKILLQPPLLGVAGGVIVLFALEWLISRLRDAGGRGNELLASTRAVPVSSNILRPGLAAAAAVLWAAVPWVYSGFSGQGALMDGLVLAALFLALASELIGRYRFYQRR